MGVWVEWVFGGHRRTNRRGLVISGEYFFLRQHQTQYGVKMCCLLILMCFWEQKVFPGQEGGSAVSTEGAFLMRHNHSSSCSWSSKIIWHFLQEEWMTSIWVGFLLDQLLCFCFNFPLSLSASSTCIFSFLSWAFVNVALWNSYFHSSLHFIREQISLWYASWQDLLRMKGVDALSRTKQY